MAILDLLEEGLLRVKDAFGDRPIIFILSWVLVFWSWHIVTQLLPRDKTKPPVVFHFLPFVGSAISYGTRPYEFFAEQRAKYGDIFTFVLLGRRITVMLGPEGNESIFNGKLAYVNAEEAYTALTTPVFGTDVVYDVPNHVLMEQKKFVKYGLTTDNFRAYVPMIVDEVTSFLDSSPRFGLNTRKSGVTESFGSMAELTIFTASRTLQGQEVRAGFDATFAKLFWDLDHGFQPINFIAPWLPLPGNKKRDGAREKMHETYSKIIGKRRASGEAPARDMIWNLMQCEYKQSKRPLTDHEIAGIMIALLMAGQHTSAATSSWLLLHLAERPDIVEKLLKEQEDVLGRKTDGTLEDVTYDKLKDLTLLSFVVKETLRLHPPTHSIMRKIIQDMPIGSTGLHVPKGEYVLACPGVSAKDARYFPDPEKFEPERWAGVQEEAEEDKDKVDYGYGLVTKGASSPYLPFGAGRHRCIGEQFAYVQLGTIVATIVRRIELSLPKQQGMPGQNFTTMIVSPVPPAEVKWSARA